ncbi:hypothetical protein [Synechococcus sp. BIOS-E4-1]|uniref:hypothetical protein n=1 Tax=Synechococcus sp. BIOS-E4-1 TaxID=1400864 RepID=UPI0016454E16|nr:hypothetical protein [Synechococcus sp. BIOS-E4-1]
MQVFVGLIHCLTGNGQGLIKFLIRVLISVEEVGRFFDEIHHFIFEVLENRSLAFAALLVGCQSTIRINTEDILVMACRRFMLGS